MIRAIIEFLFVIGLALLARAILRSVLGGVARASSQAFNAQTSGARPREAERKDGGQAPFTGGDLHKDPVCGTYVAEGSSLKQKVGSRIFYYCSESCRDKHALATR